MDDRPVDENLALLREIRDELRALRQELAGRPQGDEKNFLKLLEAINNAFGDDNWTSAALIDEASSNFPDAGELRQAIFDVAGSKTGGMVNRLGIFIAARVGRTGNYQLDVVNGKTRAGVIYRVKRM